MPSKLEHEFIKLRGKSETTKEIYTNTISDLEKELKKLEIKLNSIQDKSDKYLSEIKKVLSDTADLYSKSNKFNTKLLTLNDLIDTNQKLISIPPINESFPNNELTLDTNGAITVSQSWHTIDTFSGAASDNLETINGGTQHQILIIRPDSDIRTIVIQRLDGGNIVSPTNISLASSMDFAILFYEETAGYWYVLSYSTNGTKQIYADKIYESTTDNGVIIDSVNIKDGILTPKTLQIIAPTELTISSGAITVTQSHHTIDTEADAATDDLDTINGGIDGMILILQTNNSARDVTIRTGIDNILTGGNRTLDVTVDTLTLMFDATSNYWVQIAYTTNA